MASIDVPGEKVVLFWAVSTSSRMQQAPCPEKSAKKHPEVLRLEVLAFGAAIQIRTGDLILTKDALYQLSYSSKWRPGSGSNRRPPA